MRDYNTKRLRDYNAKRLREYKQHHGVIYILTHDEEGGQLQHSQALTDTRVVDLLNDYEAVKVRAMALIEHEENRPSEPSYWITLIGVAGLSSIVWVICYVGYTLFKWWTQ